ncbi:MAG: response regulator [Synergistaceae bacterium]|nr:response regulator [Synergistaceae bacterium]
MAGRIGYARRYIYISCVFWFFFGGILYFVTSQTLKQQMGRKCLGIASAVAVLLEEDPEGYRKFIETLDTESDYYIKTKAMIEKIRFANEDNIAFLYAEIRVSENEMMYLFDGEYAGAGTFAPPGSVEQLTATRRAAYDSASAYIGDFVTTVWGFLLSAYAPVFDRGTGEFLGIVGADVSEEQYNAVMNKQFLILLGSAILVSAMGYFLIQLDRDVLDTKMQNVGKSSFLARMSHEMRTPLNTIIGMSELISRKEIPRDMMEYVSTIHQAGRNLLSIINDILDFSKIEAGQVNIVLDTYYFASIINDAVNLTRARMADKPLDFLVKADSNIPERLVGDEIRTKQVLLNLLGNAFKYTNSGYISLDVSFEQMEDGQVRLKFAVEDSGIGIKQADIGKLFREFVRIEDEKAIKEIEGTGLGLAITRRICRAMGGDVSVESEYGRGSLFTATVVQTLADDRGGKLASVRGAESLRVLALEERPIYLASLSYALSCLGVNPVFARNFTDFTEQLEGGEYDYAFVASRRAADSALSVGKGQSRTMLVSMVEMNDISACDDISSITMPIFCVNVANVLNGVRNEGGRAVRKRLSFKAPDAKVLIVDDISTNLRVSKELVSLYGVEVHTCLSGPDAIELAQANRYDIIFMDHMMPGMDGIEAASLIRSAGPDSEYYRSLPIIALTANALSGQLEMFLENGMNDFLAKPIDLQRLDSILKKWLPKEKQLAADSESETPGGASRAEMFGIPGVSVETGLANSGGTVEAYLDILAVFCADVEEKSEQIAKCAANGDIGLFLTLVHAFKGASRSIGAMEFGDFAARMESAARTGDAGVIAEETGAFLVSAHELVYNIRNSLKRADASRRREGGDLTQAQMEALRSALTSMDIAAANRLILEYAALPLSGKARKTLSDIENSVLMFDYEKAIEIIDGLEGV